MAWERPTLETIYERITNGIESRLTGGVALLRRAVLRVLAKVFAGEIHLNYGYGVYLSKQLLPDQAEVEWLDRHAYIWGVVRKGGAFAFGVVRFTGTNGVVIPAGTLIQTGDGVEYSTDVEGIIAGGLVDVNVSATEAGEAGNYSGADPLQLISPITGIDAPIVRQGLIAGGVDPETDDELRVRVVQRIQEPPMGGARHDYVRWALEVDGVAKAWCYAPDDAPAVSAGIVRVVIAATGPDPEPTAPLFVDDGTGKDDGTGTAFLYIEQRRPVAAELQVWALVNIGLYFTIKTTPFSSEIATAIEDNLRELFASVSVPGATMPNAQIRDAIMRSGVDNFVIFSIFNSYGQQLDPFGDILNAGFNYLTLGDPVIVQAL